MQRFEFSLDRVLKVKRQIEALAERELVRARQATEAAHARAAELRQRLADVSQAMADRIGQVTAPHQWLAAFETSERIGEAIAAAERHIDECEARMTAASQERAQVAAEVQALDTLRQQQLDQWRRTYEQAEQDASDEFVGQRLTIRSGAA